MTSAGTRDRYKIWFAAGASVFGLIIFQFLGNSTRGYIGTSSLFYWWGFQWLNPQSETQHGVLILGLSVWILVRNIRSEAAAPVDGFREGTAALVAGMLLHVVGYVAEQARLSILGLLFFLWGISFILGGRRWGRAAAFPLAFMVFAIPFNALDSAGFWLRMWVVSASSSLAHAVGIPVVVSGTQLVSPDGRYNYDVAAACSGVRSLVALGAISFLIGYLRFRPWWLRLATFALCFPLVYVGNVARILSIIVAAQVGGQKWGDVAHEVMGYGVFAIVLGGVFFACEAVGRRWPRWSTDSAPPTPAAERAIHIRSSDTLWGGAAAAVCVLSAALLIYVSQLPMTGRAGITLDAGGAQPAVLPSFIGVDWVAKSEEVTEVERQLLPADTGFSRKTYVSLINPADQVFLSIVLSGHDRTSIHRPELCLVGQGWTINGSLTHHFADPRGGQGFEATILRVEHMMRVQGRQVAVPHLVAYYFVGGDQIVASHWQRMARDAWNRLFHARADRWAYVLLLTRASDGEPAAYGRIQEVLNGTLPAFQKPI